MPAVKELVTVELKSTSGVYTPGLIKWAINGYRFKRDRKAMVRLFMDGYNLTKRAADDLLSEKIPHDIDGDSVVFEYEAGKWRRSPPPTT